ncbi:MAG: 16S rRNA (cytidine(1402)-2'-O)-methyltransferase [Gaiellales bacterium]
MSGALVVCPTPIGNLADVTLRVLDALRTADAAACEDTRHSQTLLRRHGISLPLISLTEHNEAARIPGLVERVSAGERIGLLSDAGMPAVSDPGSRLISAVLEAGLTVEVLPGPSAVTAALVASGMARGGFVFAGFLPKSPAAIGRLLDRLDAPGLPVVAFESPRRLPATLAALAERDPSRPLAVCRELTKLHEEVVRGMAAEVAARFPEPPRGEITLVLGGVEARPAPIEDAVLRELADAVGARRAAGIASSLSGHPRNAIYRRLTGGQ